MRVFGKKAIVVALMLSPLMLNNAWADEAALSQRIDRLERIIKGQGLTSLLGRVDRLQNEVQRLNGENESLRHQIETMQKRQRDLYLDLDQRIQAQATAVQPTTDTQDIPTVDEPELLGSTEQEEPAVEPADTTEENTTEPETSPVSVENGEAAYQAALQTLRSGQYEQAAAALTAFPEQYPHSSYLPNAYYWQGEANYVLRNFEVAITSFQKVIDDFPASSKVADATLKQGFSQYELGQVNVAKSTLSTVIQQYPNTSAARLAKVRLDRIRQANP